jgi:hypothetical protein
VERGMSGMEPSDGIVVRLPGQIGSCFAMSLSFGVPNVECD